MVFELQQHQLTALEKMHNGTVLTGGVGVGKTHTALGYYYTKVLGGELGKPETVQKPIDIYVITTAKKRDSMDWQGTAAQLSITREREASIYGIQLTVDSYNNIANYKDVEGAFFIFDEQRLVGSGIWAKVFVKIALKNQWILLSATPGDTWLDYIPLFLANGFYKNRTQFKQEHCKYSYYGRYPKLEGYTGVAKLLRYRDSILVEMPYDRHTTRHIHTVPVDYDKELFEQVVKKRWHVYEERPLKDVAELFSVMRKVVNTAPSRLEEVRSLLERTPRLIVFYNFDYELEMLRTLIPTDGEPTNLKSSTPDTLRSTSGSRTSSKTSPTTPTSSRESLTVLETEKSLADSSRDTSIELEINTNENSSRGSRQISPRCPTAGSPPTTPSSPTISPTSRKTRSERLYELWGRKKTSDTPSEDSSASLFKNGMKDESVTSTDATDSSTSAPTTDKESESWQTSQASPKSSSKGSWGGSSLTISGKSSFSSADGTLENRGRTSTSTGMPLQSTENAQSLRTRSSEDLESTQSISTNIGNGSIAKKVRDGATPFPVSRSGDTTVVTDLSSSSSTPRPQTPVQIAEWNGHKHEPVPTSERWVYLVQYVAGAEAWNCIETNAVCFFSLTYSYRNFEQAQGRIDRLNTPFSNLHYYVLTSKSMIDRAILRALQHKQDFNESSWRT